MKIPALLIAGLCTSAPMVCAQQTALASSALKAVAEGEIPLAGPRATAMHGPARCDGPGNVFVRLFDPSEAQYRNQTPIVKVTSAARLARTIAAADSAQAKAAGIAFFVDRAGTVYELMTHLGIYEVVEFAANGTVKARTKLDLDARSSQVQPSLLGVFKSGEFLLAGTTFMDKNGRFPDDWASTGRKALHHTPFTAVFAANGRLVKKIYEPEDEEARQRADVGDREYTYPNSIGNKFMMLGDVSAGSDGDIYFLHGGSPRLIYVIAPSGDVIRKLRVEASNPDDLDHIAQGTLQFYAGRLAVGFGKWVNLIDTQGNPVASYEVRPEGVGESPALSLAWLWSAGTHNGRIYR